MKEVIVRFDIKDVESIDNLPNFKPAWDYSPFDKLNLREWGRIVLEDVTLGFFAYSEIDKFFVPRQDEFGRAFNVDFPDYARK